MSTSPGVWKFGSRMTEQVEGWQSSPIVHCSFSQVHLSWSLLVWASIQAVAWPFPLCRKAANLFRAECVRKEHSAWRKKAWFYGAARCDNFSHQTCRIDLQSLELCPERRQLKHNHFLINVDFSKLSALSSSQAYWPRSAEHSALTAQTPCEHHTVNHSQNFLDPFTGVHTQKVECLWKKVKKASVDGRGSHELISW